MKEVPVVDFLLCARDDPRLGATHISLYVALRALCALQGGEPVLVKRKDVLGLAKVSVATYHRCLRGLVDCGYVVYYPSVDPRGASQIYFRKDLPEKDPGAAGVHPGKR